MFQQTVWIARHGNRIDFVNPEWFNTAKRPYDPHLSDDGILQAQKLANRLRHPPNRSQVCDCRQTGVRGPPPWKNISQRNPN